MCAKKMGKSKKKPRFKILKFILITILSIIIFVSVAAAGVVLAIIKTAPEVDVNSILSLNEPSTLYDDKGNFMDIVITDEKRTVISFKDMPQDLKNAFVSIEDERFYKHNGIDIKRIVGATYTNIMKKIKKQPGLHGASTITQQLIKRTVLTPEVTFKRKIQEMYMSVQLEKKLLSKDQILEAYMNNIYLGGRAYGVEAAANEYFSKKASELSLIECAFIAGMPQSPSVNYPFSPAAKRDPLLYLTRTKSVLLKMLDNGYISNAQYENSINDLNLFIEFSPNNIDKTDVILNNSKIELKYLKYENLKKENNAIITFETKRFEKEKDKDKLALYLQLPETSADAVISILKNDQKLKIKDFIKIASNIVVIPENLNKQDDIYKILNDNKITNVNIIPYKTKGLVFQQPQVNLNKLNNEWFSLPVIEAVKSDLKAQYNYTDLDVERLLMYGGLKIHSTMNVELQSAAQTVLNDDKNLGIKSQKDKNGIIQPQASATIVDYHTGEVKVIIGGRGSQPARSYNRAAFNGSKEFLRPAGSSIKPLTVYAASIDSKNATAGTVIEDSPLPEEIGKKYGPAGNPWNPRNYETGDFKGYVTIREAITRSINLVAIKLVDKIGLKKSTEYAEKFGLTLDDHDKTSISALSLGQLHHGTNTLTMAAAFGTFGNSGNYIKPILYTKVIDKTGKTVLENKPSIRKVLTPQNAYIMYDLLKGPVEGIGGTAHNAKFGAIDVRGKTGTSGDFKDLWFCGLTPYYSGAVWIGNDNPISYYNIYSSTSAGLWAKIMAEAHKDLKNKELPAPSGIVTAPICKDSGKLPTDLCSKDSRGDRVYTEIFAEGTIPTELCDIHAEAKINKSNGKLASESTPELLSEKKIFIKRNSSSSDLQDATFVIPKELDDTKADPIDNKSNSKNKTDGKSESDAVKEEEEEMESKNTSNETINNSNTTNKQETNKQNNKTKKTNDNNTSSKNKN